MYTLCLSLMLSPYDHISNPFLFWSACVNAERRLMPPVLRPVNNWCFTAKEVCSALCCCPSPEIRALVIPEPSKGLVLVARPLLQSANNVPASLDTKSSHLTTSLCFAIKLCESNVGVNQPPTLSVTRPTTSESNLGWAGLCWDSKELHSSRRS